MTSLDQLPDQRRQVAFQVVRATLWAVLIVTVGGMLFYLASDPPPGADTRFRNIRFGVGALIPLGAAVGLALLARGRLVLTVAVFAAILYAVPMISAVGLGLGVHSIGMMLWPIVILLTGFVWGAVPALSVTAFYLASVAGLTIAEMSGALPGPTPLTLGGPVFYGLIFVLLFSMVCWITIRYSRLFYSALDAVDDSRRQLAAKERQLQSLIEAEPECVKVLGTDGSLLQMNRAGLDMIEADSIEQVRGGTVLGIVAPEYREAFAALTERVIGGEAGTLEFEIIGLKGRRRWLETHAVPMTDDDGRIAGLIGVTRDVTERRRADAELRRLNETLERRVRERTAALEASNRELEAFSYSVSHDLRAPLRALDGFSHLLEAEYADRIDENGRDYLNRIRAASQRMGQLIDDIIDMARIGRQELKPVELDLAALASEIAESLAEQAPQRKVVWTIPARLKVEADPVLAKILLENLLRNAWKFSAERDEARIAFGSRRRDGEDVLYVSDNGAGFEQAYVDKLFQPFQRLHDTRRFPGTGIGLAIVSRIVRRHGGRAWAEGIPDHGATFYFTLP